MVTRENINAVLDQSNVYTWMMEDLKDDVLARVEGRHHAEPWEMLRDMSYYFYQLGRIRGIQSERARRRGGKA